MPDLPWNGGCRCGRVRFQVTQQPMLTMVCHCTGCQRMTGSAFSTSIAVPAAGFRVTAGDTVIGGMHGEQALHHHCDWCKSWVFTRTQPEMGFVNVRATMLDESGWFVPFVETYTSEALSWAVTKAPHSYPAFPTMDAYPELIEAFARRG